MPFEVPKGWGWCKLGDIVSFLGGFAYKSNTYVSLSDWQVIRIGNVKNDNLILDSQPIFVSEEIGNDTRKYMIKTDDILFSMTGTKGKRDYFFSVVVPELNRNLLLNQRVGCLRKFSKDINIHYLCLALKSQYVLDAIFSTETGNVSQGNIGSESTLNLDIALPPLSEQIRIVEEVKKWFALIAQIELGKVNLQSAIKQTKSKILDLAIHGKLVPQNPTDEPASELLKRINPKAEITCDNGQYGNLPKGWCNCRLCDVLEITMGQSPQGDFINSNDGIEFHQGKLCFSEKYLKNSNIFTTEPTKIAEVDSLLLCVRAPVGVVNITQRKICIGRGLCSLKPLYGTTLFYFYMLQTLKGSFERQSTGTTFKAISGDIVKKEIISLPPLAEQHRIVAKIEELFNTLDQIEKSLEA